MAITEKQLKEIIVGTANAQRLFALAIEKEIGGNFQAANLWRNIPKPPDNLTLSNLPVLALRNALANPDTLNNSVTDPLLKLLSQSQEEGS